MRIPFGISLASEVMQKRNEQTLSDIPDMYIIADERRERTRRDRPKGNAEGAIEDLSLQQRQSAVQSLERDLNGSYRVS